METLPDELIALIGTIGGPLNALMLLQTQKKLFAIIHDEKVLVARDKAPEHAANMDSLDIIKHLSLAEYEITEQQIIAFIERGNISALEYLFSRGVEMGDYIWPIAMNTGNIDVLDFAYNNQIQFKSDFKFVSIDIRGDFIGVKKWFDEHPIIKVNFNIYSHYFARTGNVELFKLVNTKCCTHYCEIAVMSGHFEMVKYLFSIGGGTDDVCGLNDDYDAIGVMNSIKFIIDYYKSDIPELMQNIAPAIIKLGDIEFLDYCAKKCGAYPDIIIDAVGAKMRDYLVARGAILDVPVMLQAIEARDEEMIRFYIAGGYEIDEEILCDACELDYELMALIHDAAPAEMWYDVMYVILGDNYECDDDITIKKLEYFHAKGPIDNLMTIVCSSLRIGIFTWAINRGYKFTDKEYLVALKINHYWLIDHLYEIMPDKLDHNEIFIAAIITGCTDALSATRLYASVVGPDMYVLAAKNNQLESMRWLHFHEYDWDERLIFTAIEANNFGIVKFLLDNEYPLPEDRINLAIAVDNKHAIRQLLIGRKIW